MFCDVGINPFIVFVEFQSFFFCEAAAPTRSRNPGSFTQENVLFLGANGDYFLYM